MSLAKNTKPELEEIRINADTYFREMFEQVKLMTAQYDIEIKIPRTAKRQTDVTLKWITRKHTTEYQYLSRT